MALTIQLILLKKSTNEFIDDQIALNKVFADALVVTAQAVELYDKNIKDLFEKNKLTSDNLEALKTQTVEAVVTITDFLNGKESTLETKGFSGMDKTKLN